METALLEKNRIKDEAAAFDFVLEGQQKEKELRGTLRSLKQRRDLAKELKAKGQVKLFDREIVRTERAYRIRHENPYPECNKTDAMDAMCEPLPQQAVAQSGLSDNARDALQSALSSLQAGSFIGGSSPLASLSKGFFDRQFIQSLCPDPLDAFRYVTMQPGQIYNVNNPWAQYSRQTHKYDLECRTLNLEGHAVEGSEETQTLLPMSALCRLQEAKEKKLFDHFEVWRPAEWKAPDPWLVGVYHARDERGNQSAPQYFKVCDWR